MLKKIVLIFSFLSTVACTHTQNTNVSAKLLTDAAGNRSPSYTGAQVCQINLSNTNLNSEELNLVETVLTKKGFVSCQKGRPCELSTLVTKEESNSSQCKINLLVLNNGEEIFSIEARSTLTSHGNRCSTAVVNAIKAFPTCDEVMKK